MSRSKWRCTVGVLAMGAVAVLGGWLLWRQVAAEAQEPARGLPNYDALFQAELQKVGQISPDEFARRYPTAGDYLGKISWDPTTAKFWDEFNRDLGKEAFGRGGV